MKILVVTDPAAVSSDCILGGLISETAERTGYRCLKLEVPEPSIDKIFTIGGAGYVAIRSSRSPQELAFISSIEEFAPHVVLFLPGVGKEKKIDGVAKRIIGSFLAVYSLYLAKDGQAQLRNHCLGKVIKVAPNDISKLVNIIRSQVRAACRTTADIDTTSAVFNELARAEINLRQYAAVLPYLDETLRHDPKQDFTGALESVSDEDIILDNSIWIKGWIDWDEKVFSKLIVKIHEFEFEVAPNGFRADKYRQTASTNPLSFSKLIDLDGLYSHNVLSLYVETIEGIRFEWCTRKIWISRDTNAHSATPLITGSVNVSNNRDVDISIDSDGIEIDRIACWQGGACVGLWEGSPASSHRDISFRIFPLDNSGLYAHFHVHLRDIGYVSWLAINLDTGASMPFRELDMFSVATDDIYSLSVSDDKAQLPVSILLDGKLVDVVGRTATVKIDISQCMGLATIQILGRGGEVSTSHIWRHCKEPSSGRRLPAFVLPPAETRPKKYLTYEDPRPKLLLIRQAAAPTDELYILSALVRIGEVRAYSLDIVNMIEKEHSLDEMEKLLGDGVSVIISRYISPPWIEAISRRRNRLRDIFYIMDDDVTLAENDIRMPDSYRQRMIGVAHGEFQTLLHLSTRFVVTSRFLFDRYRSDKTDLITPPYILPPTTMDHQDDLSEIRIEYHGTQVHRVDLDAIASALVWIHDNYPNVKIRTYMGKSAPQRFRACKRIEIVPDIPWEDYKAAVSSSPAHIALAPMLETPYNKGKSFVKIMDIARLGAVGLYTRRPPYSDVIHHGVDGLLLENDALIWRYALAWLLDNPSEIKSMALAAQVTAQKLGNIDILADYWIDRIFTRTMSK